MLGEAWQYIATWSHAARDGEIRAMLSSSRRQDERKREGLKDEPFLGGRRGRKAYFR
jgi:hypothetical protein